MKIELADKMNASLVFRFQCVVNVFFPSNLTQLSDWLYMALYTSLFATSSEFSNNWTHEGQLGSWVPSCTQISLIPEHEAIIVSQLMQKNMASHLVTSAGLAWAFRCDGIMKRCYIIKCHLPRAHYYLIWRMAQISSLIDVRNTSSKKGCTVQALKKAFKSVALVTSVATGLCGKSLYEVSEVGKA